MKLKDQKSVMLCQKALYAKELEYYSNLCEIYESLAQHAIDRHHLQEIPGKSVAEQVRDIYGKYLTMASNGDTSFLENNRITTSTYQGPRFDSKQIELIKNYSKYASAISHFKLASEKLALATTVIDSNGKPRFEIDEEALDDYHKFMQSTPRTRSFDKFISENPKRWIGHNFYLKSRSAISKIRKIDPEHIENIDSYEKRLTPESFAAAITGARGTISRFTPVKDQISSEFDSTYTKADRAEYKDDLSNLEAIYTASYVLGNRAKKAMEPIGKKISQVYTTHKGTLNKAILTGVAIAMLTGVGMHLNDAHIYNQTSATENPQNGYQVLVSEDTQSDIASIYDRINELRNSTTTPTYQELMEVRDSLDETITDIISDLTIKAIQEKYPNLTDIKVEDYYDLKINQNIGSSGEPSPQEFILVHATDENGKPVELSYSNFLSTRLTQNPLGDSIVDEETLDMVSTTPGKTLRKRLNSLLESSDSTYIEKTENVQKILDTFEEILKSADHVAGGEISILPFHTLLITTPDKIEEEQHTQEESSTVLAKNEVTGTEHEID